MIPLPNKKYKIIYADPPWNYRVWAKDKNNNGCASSHYLTMDIKDIKKIPVKNIADKNSVLLLWCTFPQLQEALELIPAWGFKYKTVAFTWIKTNRNSPGLFWGLGHYTRTNSEICILASRGKSLPRISKSVHQVIVSPITIHSEKPPEARTRIVELFGDVPRIELFSRQKTEGWDVWGNEIDKMSGGLL